MAVAWGERYCIASACWQLSTHRLFYQRTKKALVLYQKIKEEKE